MKQESSDEEIREKLTPLQYRVLRKKGTELPFTGKYWRHKEKGLYKCALCGEPLFDSESKYDSGTGWPSFSDALQGVGQKEDNSFLMKRSEAVCKRCKSHLGHVFLDGPKPTGKRYCINSASLDFEAA